MNGIKTYVLVASVACLASAASALVVLELATDRQTAFMDKSLQRAVDKSLQRAVDKSLQRAVDKSLQPVLVRLADLEAHLKQTEGSVQANPSGSAGSTAQVIGEIPESVAINDRRGSDRSDFRLLMDESADPEVRRARALEMLESSAMPARMLAVRALVQLDDPQALEAVQSFVAQAGDDPRSQRMLPGVVELLSDVGSPGVDAQLYEYLGYDVKSVQLSAARQLEQRGDANPMAQMVDEIAQRLDSKDSGERSRAAQELGRTGSASAVEPLAAALKDDSSEVRLRAVQGLGRTAAESAIPALTAALEDPVAEVRSSASRSLDVIRNPDIAGPSRFGRSVFVGSQ